MLFRLHKPPINPLPHIMLVVDLRKRFYKGLSLNAVAAQEVEFFVDGPRDGTAKSFLKNIYLSLDIFISSLSEKNAQLTQYVSLSLRQGNSMFKFRLPVFNVFGKLPYSTHDRRIVSFRQGEGLLI